MYECPRAASTVLDGTVVDDLMDSVPEEEDARELIEQLQRVINSCGMTIHKWASSHPQVLPVPSVPIKEFSDNSDDFPSGKALGLSWHTQKDELRFKLDKPKPQVWTKMSTLKHYMSLFDPLGLVLPFVVKARFLFKETWQAGLPWEKPLPEKLAKAWDKWHAAAQTLPQVRIPRWLRLENIKELHVFGDASSQGYGVVVYTKTHDGIVTLVCAKARVISSPSKTIPKGEIDSSHMAATMATKVALALGVSLDLAIYWSDSCNALQWIKAPSRDLNNYCARKAAQIRESSDPCKWYYTPTADNPADLVTRGKDPIDLADRSLWLQGPRFFTTGEWPEQKIQAVPHNPLPNEEELRRLVGIFHARTASEAAEDILHQVSTWTRGRRILAYASAFIDACRGNKHPPYLEDGEDLWIKFDQHKHYAKEIACVQEGMRPKGAIWQQYDLFWQDHMLKIGGRTNREPRPVLHSSSRLLKLWLTYLHKIKLRHAGGWKVLLNESRKTIWSFGVYHLIKSVLRDCVECKRRNPHPNQQRMAPLPDFRFQSTSQQAFESIAIDFAGPWFVKIGTGQARQSRLVMVICCTTFRAIRCEIVTQKETSNVLMALQRFSCRNRVPNNIYSDNAAEFKRAALELKALNEWNFPGQGLDSAWQNVNWTHCHPVAPHTNGVVESMVGITKRALERVLAMHTLTDEMLWTACHHAEDILNSRPIGNISMDPRDPEPLTPGMFLGHAPADPPLPIPNHKNKFTDLWKQMNNIREHLYQRFQCEIVPELEKRYKWWDIAPKLQTDDIVICLKCDPTQDGRWPLGRVAEVLHGKDGLPRGAWVWVNGKFLKRHIHHLVPLL